MKRLLVGVLAVVAAVGGTGVAEPPSVAVFILAGQSNMEGQGKLAELDVSLSRQPANIEFYLSGVHSLMIAQPTVGPEFSLASELSQAMPARQIVFVKYALGGVSLLAWAPDWVPTRAALTENEQVGPLYRNLLDQIGAITRNKTVEFSGVFWMQGERDARYPAAAAEYETNLAEFIQRLRRDLKTPQLPFIFGQVNPPASTYPGLESVRSAQVRIARAVPNTKLVATDDLTKLADGLHYDTSGQVSLGRRFALAYLALPKQ
jgi:hypothetical protein